jgi:1-pyrroline-5-carboxylate dehydrogenase
VFAPFSNEALTDFAVPDNVAAYRQALGRVRGLLGQHRPLLIGGREVDTGDRIASLNPARPAEVLGTAAAADPGRADQALEAAWRAFPGWAARPAESRAAAVARLAAELRRRRLELAAWETLEASKNWVEADADVAEAIDYCAYYARQALEFARPRATHQLPGQINRSWLKPLGAGVVIPPWNFPLAILTGMTVGPVAAGNTVVLKPSSYTPLTAAAFMDAAAAAGIPDGVINFLPGSGSKVGDYLVDHPRTRFVNFTGSKEVGVRIGARAARLQPGQHWLKRVSLEMGGKDAIIVDETADLEAAVEAIIRSAFAYQGQKCSAASRLICVAAVYDEMLARLLAAVANLVVGPAEENFPVNALIAEAQQRQVLAAIGKGAREAQLVAGGRALNLDGGYYLEPTVFAMVPPASSLGQDEVFGPVLAVLYVADFDAALRVANGTEYGLTGGLFSRSRERIEQAGREFEVGNLYINRKITGALVGAQPFGGFKMSGSNAKAGGPDYLRLFLEMKTVTEQL